MRILLASSEVHPFSKTGGLADMVGALGKALAQAGHKVGIVTPLYMGIRERFPQLERLKMPLDFPLGLRRVSAELWTLKPIHNLTIYLLDQPEFFQRAGLYQKYGVDYEDNAERFIFFSKVVAHLALHLHWKPEILHLNDWQTGFAALFLHHERRLPTGASAPHTCMTIHNLAYQGLFPTGHYALTNLPWDYFVPEGAEFHGKMSCLKTGIAYSRLITTVSPSYAREITTPEYGCGLDGLLRHRAPDLAGILNGVDYDEWKTVSNPYLKHSYSLDALQGKLLNKADLLQEFGLPATPELPLFASIGRLAEQKGVDIMLGAVSQLLSQPISFVLLGTGEPAFERAYKELAARHPGRAAVRIGFDQGLSHRIEAGCDFFLMPSRFEPCGLNQMYSLRYGAIPIVRATGGLRDTVIDVREDPWHANGIKFADYSVSALLKATHKASALYREPALLERYQRNAMAADFSWNRTAAQYVDIYRRLTEARGA